VASARAKVEVLDSVKDAIKDESDSSDSSSEADDEGDGNVEDTKTVPELVQQSSPESEPPIPQVTVKTAPPLESFPAAESQVAAEEPAPRLHPPGPLSLPPSPFLSSFKDHSNMLTPPPPDFDLANGTERNSILKALSGFWLQQPPTRSPFEGDDPMNDPEHIFRDSSMVVRTDEPTSIIALALK
jgi:1-phosphatidylinositol-3-phosphate 5-kinase